MAMKAGLPSLTDRLLGVLIGEYVSDAWRPKKFSVDNVKVITNHRINTTTNTHHSHPL